MNVDVSGAVHSGISNVTVALSELDAGSKTYGTMRITPASGDGGVAYAHYADSVYEHLVVENTRVELLASGTVRIVLRGFMTFDPNDPTVHVSMTGRAQSASPNTLEITVKSTYQRWGANACFVSADATCRGVNCSTFDTKSNNFLTIDVDGPRGITTIIEVTGSAGDIVEFDRVGTTLTQTGS